MKEVALISPHFCAIRVWVWVWLMADACVRRFSLIRMAVMSGIPYVAFRAFSASTMTKSSRSQAAADLGGFADEEEVAPCGVDRAR